VTDFLAATYYAQRVVPTHQKNRYPSIRQSPGCPGAIRTPALDAFITANPRIEARMVGRYPIGRLGTPEEVAAAAVWLCSDAAAFITGHRLVMDGGAIAQ
jgi:NAD(P)-dependent dehydrogenase (short-subunit alcohol dehydrogenase family)